MSGAHYLSEELVAIRSLVHVVQYRSDAVRHWTLELDLDHVARTHATTLGHAVDQRLVQIDNECFLRRVSPWGWRRI